jgi:RNA-directed DNA polymerase
MQTKLHCWAVTDRDRRFDDLYNLVCDPAFLTIAWERVAGNKGSRTPGGGPGHCGSDQLRDRG